MPIGCSPWRRPIRVIVSARTRSIPKAVLEELAARHRITPWTVFGTLYGTKHVVAAAPEGGPQASCSTRLSLDVRQPRDRGHALSRGRKPAVRTGAPHAYGGHLALIHESRQRPSEPDRSAARLLEIGPTSGPRDATGSRPRRLWLDLVCPPRRDEGRRGRVGSWISSPT